MNKYYFFIMINILIVLALACSNHNTAVVPDQPEMIRQSQIFEAPVQIFPDEGEGIFYDADISEILQGPAESAIDPGFFWEDADENTWSVAVALEETGENLGDTDRMIRYRFLGPSDGNGEMSIMYEIDGIEGNIRFARVAACAFDYHISHASPAEYDDWNFIEVAITFQMWDEDRWRIHVYRMGFDPADFDVDNTIQDWQNVEPLWTVHGHENAPLPEYGDMMPDIAYDPRIEGGGCHGGNLWLTFTRYTSTTIADVMIKAGKRYTLDPPGPPDPPRIVTWSTAQPAQSAANLSNGFHPRIDVGNVIPVQGDPDDWYIGIAYTQVQYGRFIPSVTYGSAVWPFVVIHDIPVQIGPYNQYAGGMPAIDIGLPGSNHAAIVWTQSRSESWNDCTVGYVDNRNNYFYLHDKVGNQDITELICSASPSIAVWNIDPGLSQASISYLQTDNPNSLAWIPSAITVPNGVPDLGDEMTFSASLRGEYDSGSQYTNWYGMNSGITAGTAHMWAIWSSCVGSQEGLNQVHGAYGFTE